MSKAQIERISKVQTMTFTSGTTQSPVSSVADIRTAEWFGIIGATAFGSSYITFQVAAASSGTFVDLYQANTTQVTLTLSTAAARAYVLGLSPEVLAPWPWMRLVSPSTGEAATRTLYLFTK